MGSIVQAGKKSGSLVTAYAALDQGKTVATIPASLLDFQFAGNLKLLQEGASMILTTQDLKDLLNLKQTLPSQTIITKIEFDTKEEEKVYQSLKYFEQTTDKIVLETGLNPEQVATALSMLEINSLAKNLGENQWIKS